MAYLPPVVDSGSPGSRELPTNEAVVRDSIDAIRALAEAHGWTCDDNGTKAETTLFALAIAARSGPPGGFSQAGAFRRFGIFDGELYMLWDPFSTLGGPGGVGDVDPTGDIDVVTGYVMRGVSIGMTPDATIANFAGEASGNTRWDFTFAPLDMSGSGSGTVTAKDNGPEGNADSGNNNSDGLIWAPSSDNLAGSPPRRGGWFLTSTPNPTTGDVIELWVFENGVANLTLRPKLNADECDEYPIFWSQYYFSLCPYQFTAQELADQEHDAGDSAGGTGGTGYIVSALHVPDEYAYQETDIDSVFDESGEDLVLTTSVAHDLVHDQTVTLVDCGALSGVWWVADVPTANTFKISETWLGEPKTGIGAVLGAIPLVARGISESMFASGALHNDFFTETKSAVKLNGVFKKDSWNEPAYSAGQLQAVSLPLMNIGNIGTNGSTSAEKPILHAPYVQLAPVSDAEARIAGLLWDSYVSLTRQDFSARATLEGEVYRNWLEQTAVLRLVEASLWINSGVPELPIDGGG